MTRAFGKDGVSDRVRQEIYQVVERDLRPSWAMVYGKTGVSVLVGGLVSLFFCGQFQLGFSSLAQFVNGWIIAQAGMLGCTAYCGALFAVLPVAVLRLISTPLQFRALRHRSAVPTLVWIGAFGAFMTQVDSMGNNPLWMLLTWTAAGWLSFWAMTQVVDRFPLLLERRLGA